MRWHLNVLAMSFTLAVAPVQAQDGAPAFALRRNVLKAGLSSGLVRTGSVMYERVLNDEWSVALTASYLFPGKPAGFFDLHTNDIDLSSGRRLTGWFLTPEVRWYLEKSDVRPAPRGFHLGGYGRISNMRFTSGFSAVGTGSDASGSVTGDIRIDLSELGLGIQAGYQMLLIHERLALDFIFFGPRWSYYTLKVKADLQGEGQLAEDLQQALEEALGREIVPVSVEVKSNGTSTSGLNAFGYRFAIKVGYAF
jgi:hypothetical protein